MLAHDKRIQGVVLITKRVTIDHPCPEIPVNTGMLLVIHGRTLIDDRERGIGFLENKISGSEKRDDIEYDGVIYGEGVIFLNQVDGKTGIEQLLSIEGIIGESTEAVRSRHGTRCAADRSPKNRLDQGLPESISGTP